MVVMKTPQMLISWILRYIRTKIVLILFTRVWRGRVRRKGRGKGKGREANDADLLLRFLDQPQTVAISQYSLSRTNTLIM